MLYQATMCVYISKQQGLNRCDCSKVTLDAHIHLLRGTPRLAGACKSILKECTYRALKKNIGYKLLCRCPAGLTDRPGPRSANAASSASSYDMLTPSFVTYRSIGLHKKRGEQNREPSPYQRIIVACWWRYDIIDNSV
jgi:hypothetical protein